MTMRINTLRLEAHAEIGEIIERDVGTVIARWAERARAEQPTASRVHHDVLVDHLPSFLAKLGRSLAAAGDITGPSMREAEEHGDQRWDAGWSITELVRDYQLLRIVLTEFLEESLDRQLGPRESLVLNVVIDDAIAASVAAYAASQQVPVLAEGVPRTTSHVLLLNILGMIGHELRNPLAPLRNSLEILRMAGKDPIVVEKCRQVMDRQFRVLGRLVEDMMDLPRLARGKMTLRRQRLDLSHLIRECTEDRREGLVAANLELLLELPDEPVWVIGDETRLTQALGNLLANAQKFTDRGGSVILRLSVEDGWFARICVRDTGIGIEAAMLPKVFEAFTQADRSIDRSHNGLGLGLALVKGVVELHGGSVTAFSDGPGLGSTFTVLLPLAEPAPPQLLQQS